MLTGHLGTEYRMFVFLQTFGILQKLLVWDFNEFLERKPHVLYECSLFSKTLGLTCQEKRVEARASQPRLFMASQLQQPA